ncbi:MAG: efflux RND transporter periplasmic adaptor subunit [Bacteroidales bacterium]
MDIPRPSAARQRRIRRIIYGVIGLAVIALVTVGLSRLKPAAPTVDKGTVWPDTVKRGPMIRQVRGLGVLVPEDIRWIPAATQGRVERIVVRPGAVVTPDTVILEMSNPILQQALLEAQSQLKAAEANLSATRVRVQNDLLAQTAAAASLEADYKQAKLQAEADAELARQGIVADITMKLSTMKADQYAMRLGVEQKRLEQLRNSTEAQLGSQIADVERLRAALKLRESEVAQLKVRAGMPGVLQILGDKIEEGAQVAPGANLARVANPNRLKAELKVAETQAKDVQVGQPVSVDTRNGVIQGKVSRVDPAVVQGSVTVDVALEGEMPKGARPDLSVDGTIELERLDDVLYMGRPAYGQENSTISVFKLEPDGVTAIRRQVKVGRTSVTNIEIKSGLKAGDQVILSDMTQFDQFDRVRLK